MSVLILKWYVFFLLFIMYKYNIFIYIWKRLSWYFGEVKRNSQHFSKKSRRIKKITEKWREYLRKTNFQSSGQIIVYQIFIVAFSKFVKTFKQFFLFFCAIYIHFKCLKFLDSEQNDEWALQCCLCVTSPILYLGVVEIHGFWG